MVTVTKNGITMKVPSASYPLIFEPAGWRLEGHGESENTSQTNSFTPRIDANIESEEVVERENSHPLEGKFDDGKMEAEDNELEELLETPLSNMTTDELKRVANKLGVSIEGCRTKGDVRKRIAERLELEA